jgi:hypothetical protein
MWYGVLGRFVSILSLFLSGFFFRSSGERGVAWRKELLQSAFISFLGLLPLMSFRPSFLCFRSLALPLLSHSYILGDLPISKLALTIAFICIDA